MWRRAVVAAVVAAAAAAAAAAACTLAIYRRRRRSSSGSSQGPRRGSTARKGSRGSRPSAGNKTAVLRRSSTLAGLLSSQPSPKSRFHNRFLGDETKSDRNFRVLALDGGGTRGAFSARILQRLCKACPEFLENVDIIAGTSTGSLLAILLALGYDADETFQIFNTAAPKIFPRPPWWRLYNPASAKYSGLEKMHIFERITGREMKLADLERYVMITVFSMEYNDTAQRREVFYGQSNRWHPGVFTNLPQRGSRVPTDGHVRVLDAAMAATAAPTFFPIYQGFIDGGVFANNPSLCAVARILDTFPESASTDNISVLSLGTGARPSRMFCAQEDVPLGLVQWLPQVLPLMNDSSEDAVNFHMSMILGDGYHRVDDFLPRTIPLDDASPEGMNELIAAADAVDLTQAIAWVHKHFLERVPQRTASETNLGAPVAAHLRNFYGPAAATAAVAAATAASAGDSVLTGSLEDKVEAALTAIVDSGPDQLQSNEAKAAMTAAAITLARTSTNESATSSASDASLLQRNKLVKFDVTSNGGDEEEEEEEDKEETMEVADQPARSGKPSTHPVQTGGLSRSGDDGSDHHWHHVTADIDEDADSDTASGVVETEALVEEVADDSELFYDARENEPIDAEELLFGPATDEEFESPVDHFRAQNRRRSLAVADANAKLEENDDPQ